MEILIVGGLLVALMIWASTRIKRNAAAAWEEETIAGDGFVIKKPEGFLNVIGGDPQYAFEAYSRDFGGAGAEDVRAAYATVSVHDASLHETETGGRTQMVGERRYLIEETESVENGVPSLNLSKSAEAGGRVYLLKVRLLSETSPELMRKIESMIESFEVN